MIDVIANRYAEALFQIGEEENKTDNLYNELKEVSSLITTNNELNNVMKSPLVSKKEKIQLIDTLFAGKIDNDLKNFLKILIFGFLPMNLNYYLLFILIILMKKIM